MLGKTAGGLFWMFRYLERSENTARLVETGFRIALTKPGGTEWASVLKTAAAEQDYASIHSENTQAQIIDYLLRDPRNPSSVLSAYTNARQNARMVRTALTREVWEAVNDGYGKLKELLSRPIKESELPNVLAIIRQHSSLVRGTMHGSMLRNDGFAFCRVGTFLERADNTARILNVKYYVLLPSVTHVGSSIDNVQWETILRSVSGVRAYNSLHPGVVKPTGIADFLILDHRMPRSLRYSTNEILNGLTMLEDAYGQPHRCLEMAQTLEQRLKSSTVEAILDEGLHQFLTDFLESLSQLGLEIQDNYKFI